MAGRGVVISLTDSYRQTSYGEPVAAFKSFILSPFTDEDNVETVVEKVLEARGKVNATSGNDAVARLGRFVSHRRQAARANESVAYGHAVAGRGLKGDRYFDQTGNYSTHPGSGRT